MAFSGRRNMQLWSIIKLPFLIPFRAISRLSLLLNRHKYRYIFILGHMRSGSSLLAHILADSSEVAGAGESHITYQTTRDLPRLILRTCEVLHRPILREAYVVDQINHSYVTDEVIMSGEVHKWIVLLRKPEETLKSMMAMSPWKEQEVLEIYINRLQSLTHMGSLLKRQAILLEYDDLVDRPNDTLAALTDFIGLNSPLSEKYKTHRYTARAGYGDPSNNIKSGQVVRTPKHDIPISEATVNRAMRAFHDSRNQLRAVTTQIGNSNAFAHAE